jgi:hypothetical protein
MTENDTKEIMEKSLLKIPEKDFTEKVMERIHVEAAKKPQFSRDIKFSWLCITLAAFVLPFGLKFVIWVLSLFDPYVVQYLHKFSDSVIIQIGSVLLATMILLIQLDNLFRITFFKNRRSVQFISS